jgi:biopolymer transport protein ExbB
MIESLKNVMIKSGATWVLWLLIGLSVASLALAAERRLYMFSRRADLDALLSEFQRCLKLGKGDETRRLLLRSKSVAASVVLAGMARASSGPKAVAEAMAAITTVERARLERGLGFLGTVGNNAPFVGLLGTVIGIVGAFDALGSTGPAAGGALAPERVMASIAEALVATAVGLVVAIPAVAAFNYFQGAVIKQVEAAEALGHVLLSYVEDGTVELRDATLRGEEETPVGVLAREPG